LEAISSGDLAGFPGGLHELYGSSVFSLASRLFMKVEE
jgi:hypothetical protein